MSDSKFSYEFFPPRNPEMERRLWRAMGQLERLQPEFFSMTYGALGSAQQISVDNALAMQRESPVAVAAHLTCADAAEDQVIRVARAFYDGGLRRIVALRGDAVGDSAGCGGYAYASAVGLVAALVDELDELDISVAAYPEEHPQSRSPLEDLRHLQRKFDAGASRAITQYFFDADCYLRFRDRALAFGIDNPIIPGILPIHDLDKVRQFSERCGASVPRRYGPMFERLQGDAQACYQLSVELATSLCERLLREGVDHFHFYTLNQTDMCLDISLALGARFNSTRIPSAA
ncbi:MAG: 5,10-methylenetetrahydrofolate reductase [Gammaproteobacteria bacterium]|nr:5,10-methylenetetrahydrofolate reductase [Gammaproteobacteria bacterium]